MSARTRFGLTWWGQRWTAALEALGATYDNRLPRGRTYARKGTVLDLAVAPGSVTAQVQGSRATPYRVSLRLPVFDEGTWQSITLALAGQIRHAATLLDGRMPEDIDGVLAGCGVSLFPRPGELRTRCSCPDVANPCKHVAAVHYVLAQTFDADPFLLPALRGRDRDALLAGLRTARAGGGVTEVHAPDEIGAIELAGLSAQDLWTSAGDVSAIRVRPARSRDPSALLRRLGPPPGPLGLGDAEFACEDLIASAADLAWRLATANGEEPKARRQ